ncbi:MAG: phenylacetate-CoA oxygenase/reductase subunit PaaK [Proteobacteria bacterium]|nr:phenylacetate-CoA oxygenase/reductase subunit PaaK [Pseudomonadota bacterium]
MTVFHPLKIKKVVKETRDAVSVCFEIPEDLKDAYTFTQGQHLTLKKDFDGEELRRSYSICSAVGEPDLRVAIKQIDGGRFSNFANENFEAGQVIDVMEPQGRFFTPIDPNNAKQYLAMAAGSGITPILSIIKTILREEEDSRVTLVYGNRSVSSILFLEELEDLKNRYPHRFNLMNILSRERQDAEIFNGRINGEKCKELLGAVLDPKMIDEVFLCGPEQMIMDVQDVLADHGISRDHIHFELFITDAALKAGAAPKPVYNEDSPKRKVSIILDGRETEVEASEEGKPILDAALEQGLDLPFACKGGVCSTCRAKIVQGEVRMDINYALEEDEVAEGYVLTCQSHPLTDDVIVDYDA